MSYGYQLGHDSLTDAKGLPLLATRTLAMVSGMLVPAASSVRPITVSGICRVSPVIRNIQIKQLISLSLN